MSEPANLSGATGISAGTPLITASNIGKSYQLGRRSLEVLRGVNLTVGRGDFLALRGASGAGKSTLLHLLGGLDTPNAGEIRFDGRPLAALSSGDMAAFRNRSVGFIFQSYHLLPELDALENVCLPARMARIGVDDCTARGRTLLERVGLKDRVDHKPYELSGGEQQRVAIARALINQPALILADEPTGNLDSHTGEGIIELLCDIQQERRATLIIATHDAKLAARAPRMIQLLDGRIAADTGPGRERAGT
jgi:ABC-type lipoprotein export system ATPase subunit